MIRRVLAALPLLCLGLLLFQAPLSPPLRVAGLLRLDGLSAVMLLALLLGLAITWGSTQASLLRSGLLAAGLALGYAALTLPLLLLGFAVAALATTSWNRADWKLAPLPLLALGVAWLGVRAEGWALDAPALAAALDSISFGLILLAALLGLGLPPVWLDRPMDVAWCLLLRPAWLYPLARLYELGAWNIGWVLATTLLGAVGAIWAGWMAPWSADGDTRTVRVQSSMLGAALASLGLVSEAGLAGGLIAVPATVIAVGGLAARRRSSLLWLVAGPVPLTLPFVALWLQISAAVAGGMALLAAVLWIAAIGVTVAILRALTAGPAEPAGWTLRLLASASLLAGIGSPLLLRLLVQPALVQLGAGITPYGRAVSWPWLGLEVRSASGSTVTSWHSLVIAGLLVLMMAIAYLLTRLLQLRGQQSYPQPAAQDATPVELWSLVRRNVPWLARQEGGHDDR